MESREELAARLRRLDGRPYPGYRDLRGRYDFGRFVLGIDRVQGDPFASPSRFSLTVPHHSSGLPEELRSGPSRRTGTEDRLARNLARACRDAGDRSGSGRSGMLAIDAPGQVMLARSCLEVGADATVARIQVGLPANGRRILGRVAERLLIEILPAMVEEALCLPGASLDGLRAHARAAEDADHLRGLLEERGLVAFVADGAVLPRTSGADDRPMDGAVPFQSPESLRCTLSAPHAGEVRGMGLPEGVSLVVGGGYHGKSTLLRAIERGIYNHRPGDGRERVVTRADAVKVRAEDGRAVQGIDLSPFIGQLPGGRETRCFSTADASGSTSQAAAIVEALEAGSRCLLIDEDISATNFLVRDARMARLVAPEREPITPLVQRVGDLRSDAGVSLVLVMGGSGDYFEVADRVVAMEDYLPRDVTDEAKAIAEDDPRAPGRREALALPVPRVADEGSIDPLRGGRPGGRRGSGAPRPRIRAHGTRALVFGDDEIDLSLVGQLVDESQVRAIGAILARARQQGRFRAPTPLVAAVEETLRELAATRLSDLPVDDLAAVRSHEVIAALNRLRSLRLVTAADGGPLH